MGVLDIRTSSLVKWVLMDIRASYLGRSGIVWSLSSGWVSWTWSSPSCSYLHALFGGAVGLYRAFDLKIGQWWFCFRYEFFRVAPLESGVNKRDESQKIANSIQKKLELFLKQKGQEDRLKNLKEYQFLTNGKLIIIYYKKLLSLNWILQLLKQGF